jgi:hypothetical protein
MFVDTEAFCPKEAAGARARARQRKNLNGLIARESLFNHRPVFRIQVYKLVLQGTERMDILVQSLENLGRR